MFWYMLYTPWLSITYHADTGAQSEAESGDYALCNKTRVVQFVQEWCCTIREHFLEDKTIIAFLEVSPRIYHI